MRRTPIFVGIAAMVAVFSFSLAAQDGASGAPSIPGTKDPSRVEAGSYVMDSAHSQIIWQANHFGFNDYTGIFGGITGSLTLDPANPAAAALSIEIPIEKVMTTSDGLHKHLMTADFFNLAEHPTASFKSTKIVVDGEDAKITGDLTIRGITKSVILNAEFSGAGTNPFSKKKTIGFEAETIIKRSDFGVNYGIPVVSDEVKLEISVAFEKP